MSTATIKTENKANTTEMELALEVVVVEEERVGVVVVVVVVVVVPVPVLLLPEVVVDVTLVVEPPVMAPVVEVVADGQPDASAGIAGRTLERDTAVAEVEELKVIALVPPNARLTKPKKAPPRLVP